MKKLLLVATALATLSTAACHRQPRYSQQQMMPQQQVANNGYGDPCMNTGDPQQCAQVRDAGGDMGYYNQYGMGMYMLGSMMTPYGPRSYLYPNPAYHGVAPMNPTYANSRAFVTRPGYRPYSVVHHISPATYPVTRMTVTTTHTTTQPAPRKGLFGLRRAAPATTTTTTTRTIVSTPRPSSFSSYSSRPSSGYSSYSSSRPSYSSSSSYSSRSYSSGRR